MMSGTLGLVVILLAVWPRVLLLNASYIIRLLGTPSSARRYHQRHIPAARKPIKFANEYDMIQCRGLTNVSWPRVRTQVVM